jgi:ABC-2 type transport system ATP-binding protein
MKSWPSPIRSNSTTPAVPAIETAGLSKQYGKVEALVDLTMTVPRGEVFGFLGPNGAGKTTSVKLLLGLTRATAGQARILGVAAGDRDVRRRVGYLPELFRYQSFLSGREVLHLHCRLARLPNNSWSEEIEEVVKLVGLEGRADHRVGTYSKGMTQRLGLGVALLGSPDLVILDEPTSALDPVGRRDVRDIINHLKDRGITVFLNSHLLSEVEQVCDRVAVVDHGKVIATGRLEELLGGSATRLRVTGLSADQRHDLTRFGEVEEEGEWLVVKGLGAELVPDLVAEIVRLGGRVYAVEPRHQTLEERFLQLLGTGESRSDS